MKDKTQPVWETIPGNTPAIRLYHDPDSDSYSVQYGTQLETPLSYAEASKSLGEAVMHSLQCSGKFDTE